MKVTEPIDVYIADKLFQLTSDDLPRHRLRRGVPRRRSPARPWSSSAAATASAPTSPTWPRPTARRCSRLQPLLHRHPRRAARGHRRRRRSRCWPRPGRIDFVVNTAGVLPRGDAARDHRRRPSTRPPRSTTSRRSSSPRSSSRTCSETGGLLLLFTSSSYTRGRSGYSLYSSAKAAVVNLTQALADEWAGDGVRVNCINPERTGTPMRTKAFGEEPAGTLLDSERSRASLDVLLSRRDRARSSTSARTTRSPARWTPTRSADHSGDRCAQRPTTERSRPMARRPRSATAPPCGAAAASVSRAARAAALALRAPRLRASAAPAEGWCPPGRPRPRARWHTPPRWRRALRRRLPTHPAQRAC